MRLCWLLVYVWCHNVHKHESITKISVQRWEQTSAAKNSCLQTLSKPFRMTKMEMNFPMETGLTPDGSALQCSPHNLVWTCYRWGEGLKPASSLLEDWDAVASVCLILWLDEPGVISADWLKPGIGVKMEGWFRVWVQTQCVTRICQSDIRPIMMDNMTSVILRKRELVF